MLQTDAITERGDCIGVVDDFSINQTGQITELVIAGSGGAGSAPNGASSQAGMCAPWAPTLSW